MSRIRKVEKFAEVYLPMHTFRLLTKTLHGCLLEEAFNKCVEYEQEMWPELQQRLEDFEERVKKGPKAAESQSSAFDL